MNHHPKIDAELVVVPREVLEARPRSSPPPRDEQEAERRAREEESCDNTPCTD